MSRGCFFFIARFPIEEVDPQRTVDHPRKCRAGKKEDQTLVEEVAIVVEVLEAKEEVDVSRVAGTREEVLGIRTRNHNGEAGAGDKSCLLLKLNC